MKTFEERNAQAFLVPVGSHGLHGDVVIRRLKEVPEGFDAWKTVADGVLVAGSATGNVHKLFGAHTLKQDPSSEAKVFVSHDEVLWVKHNGDHFPRGLIGEGAVYRATLQQEKDHVNDVIRSVAD